MPRSREKRGSVAAIQNLDWKAGKGKTGTRRNVTSAESHLRKQRIAKALKKDPTMVAALRKDLEKEMRGSRGESLTTSISRRNID